MGGIFTLLAHERHRLLHGGRLCPGVQPYINSSIIIQLLTVAIPALERLQKEGGEEGRKKIAAITRYVTVVLGLVLGVAYYFMVRNKYNALDEAVQSGGAAWFGGIVIVLCFTAGSALMMWLGEQINEKGIGNGISILLFAGIISRVPDGATYLFYNIFYQAGIQQLSDGWTVKTLDANGGHYENSILITDGEPEILTAPAI